MKWGSLSVLCGALLAAGACNGNGDGKADTTAASPVGPATQPPASNPAASAPAAADTINPGDFSTTINNPLFPLSSFRTIEFSGRERDADDDVVKTRTVKRLLEKTDTIAGVTVAVLEVKDYENGELIELTEDYFAQHRDGGVWYFGERVTDYEDGNVVGHEGQWLAGEGANKPGIYMPANPTVGQQFEQERAPGVAEDQSKVLEIGLEVTVPAGKFTGCMKTEDYAPLDNKTEFKLYCPQVGLVREEGPASISELIRIA